MKVTPQMYTRVLPVSKCRSVFCEGRLTIVDVPEGCHQIYIYLSTERALLLELPIMIIFQFKLTTRWRNDCVVRCSMSQKARVYHGFVTKLYEQLWFRHMLDWVPIHLSPYSKSVTSIDLCVLGGGH
jgi:hypothetical protein